jgi:DNA repair protein RadC
MEKNTTKTTMQASEIQLYYKTKVKPSERAIIRYSQDAYLIFKQHWQEDKLEFVEEFKVMLLNRANKVLGIVDISSGSTSNTIADPRIIFAAAIKANASGIIVSHNHPSGNLTPSQADIDLTRKLKEGGKLLEVQVLDHVIISTEGYYSFADEGLI